LIKRLASKLPPVWQDDLKRLHFRRQIRKGQFDAGEPEYDLLPSLLSPGDWAIDVGANVGFYTTRFSTIVGPRGRVIAFEPVPETFALLAGNVRLLPSQNVTLINAAVSDQSAVVGMQIPAFDMGLSNFYEAQIVAQPADGMATVSVLSWPLDALALSGPVRLVKVDAEGHEEPVIRGMMQLLAAHRPTLIIEGDDPAIAALLQPLGYQADVLPGSPNTLFRAPGATP
jgi:FkbM family methyltransferase